MAKNGEEINFPFACNFNLIFLALVEKEVK